LRSKAHDTKDKLLGSIPFLYDFQNQSKHHKHHQNASDGHETKIRHGHNNSSNQLTLVSPSKHLIRINCTVCFHFSFRKYKSKRKIGLFLPYQSASIIQYKHKIFLGLLNYRMQNWKFQFRE